MDVGHSRVNGGWAGIVEMGIGCLLVGMGVAKEVWVRELHKLGGDRLRWVCICTHGCGQ